MDSAKSHLGEKLEKRYQGANTTLKIIHGELTRLLQFQDIHINKAFKDVLKETWEDWIENGEAEFTKSGKRRKALYDTSTQWLMLGKTDRRAYFAR